MKMETFQEERERLNKLILEKGNLGIKRFFHLDSMAYQSNTLSCREKELMGLTASLVLRCDDCIKYHAGQLKKIGLTDDEFMEAMEVGLVVGGSITIPHIRRAVDYWEKLVR